MDIKSTLTYCHQQYRVLCATGGTSVSHQVQALVKGVDVVVATPGRLLDLIDRNALKLDRYNFIVMLAYIVKIL